MHFWEVDSVEEFATLEALRSPLNCLMRCDHFAKNSNDSVLPAPTRFSCVSEVQGRYRKFFVSQRKLYKASCDCLNSLAFVLISRLLRNRGLEIMNELSWLFCKRTIYKHIYYFRDIARCKLNKQMKAVSNYGGALSPDRSYSVVLIIALESPYSAPSINAQHSPSTPTPFLAI